MAETAPTIQPQKEWEYMAQLQKNRAMNDQAETAQVPDPDNEEDREGLPSPQKEVGFPFIMLALAIIFDIPGFIPGVDIICLITDPVAAILFGFWQKKYQNTDLLTVFSNAIAWKLSDALTVGILPSNTGLVVRTYMKTKAQQKISVIS